MRGAAALLAGAAVALLTGCAGAAEDDVRAVTTAFEDPAGDPADRCAMLAPATRAALESDESAPCADAIDQLPLDGGEVTAVEVWGGDAQVRIGDDVVFLTETGAGWKVTAAACEPRGEAPYDCELEGP
ncbi:hypothetical protein [Blastococcus sp. TF02A-30]|uniref:hypothetical protein n=1 Tax=Blastococcus sp. TF02A-30 TaxID=2250580 RepID=UPI000DEAD3FA|nr:hypothetical protein [Blastococcus sp. TF02A-30]RBY89436.1 hypothetical protein DQ241_08235 [Blastococcus sp. TF02A-30]